MIGHARQAEPAKRPLRCAFGAPQTCDQPKVIVVDTAGRLIDATPAARALLTLGTPLRCAFDRLAAADRRNGAQLALALGQALRDGHAQASFLQDDEGGTSVAADFIAMGDGDDQRRIVIIIKAAHEERQRRVDEARIGFGLTVAEGRLLATLFEGCSVPQAATRLGVARSTARTHLQRIFDKTGARRQGDLMRIVACV